MTVRGSYLSAVGAFTALVDELPTDRWDTPALGVWSLRDLVGHTAAAALSQVVTVLDRPAESAAIPSAAGYYALARSIDPAIYQATADAATRQARSDGAALGDDPAGVVHVNLACLVAPGNLDGQRPVRPQPNQRVVEWKRTWF